MQITPFQHLRNNINNVHVIGDELQKQQIKNALSRMLDRLDSYFIENNLYACANYEQIVQDIISSPNFKIVADVNKTLKNKGRYGEYQFDHETERVILVDLEQLINETQLEGALCHEFIHHLTDGNNIIEYIKNNESHKVTLPHVPKGGNAEIGGTDIVTDSNGVKRTEYIEAHRGQTFINEGFVEYIKQQIYSGQESAWAYEAQTSMISFIVDLFGNDTISDFFSGNLASVSSHFSKEEWTKFMSATTSFQKIDGRRYDWPNSQYYITAQDIVVNSAIKEITSDLKSIKLSELIRVLSTIKGDAPLTPIDRQRYDKVCTETINKYCAQTSTNPQLMRKLIARTIVSKADQKQNIFQANLTSNPILIKQTSAGFALSMDGKKFVYSQQFPTTMGTPVEQIADDGWKYKITNNGTNVYTIVFSNTALGQEENIRLIHNEGSIIIADKQSNKKYIMDFDKEKKKRAERIQENQRLLNNPKYIEMVSSFVSQGQKVYNIREVIAENGKKYFVVSKPSGKEFFSVEDDGLKKVSIVKQAQNIPQTKITRKTTLVGTTQSIYANTKEQTDSTSIQYTLEDGSTFVKYFTSDGKELIAQKDGDALIERTNSSLYSSSNTDLVGVFDSSYFKQEITRDPTRPAPPVEETTNNDETRSRQAEFDRRRTEMYKQQRMTQEQQRARDKKIEDERRAQREREEKAKADFEQAKTRIEESEYYKDEYGVKIRRNPNTTQHHQSQGFSRGR